MSLTTKVIFIHCMLYFTKVSTFVSEFGAYNYIEYQPGSFNLILAAPHGGNTNPDEIQDRRAGCYDYTQKHCYYGLDECSQPNEEKCPVDITRDAYTQEITVLVADELEKLTRYRPHVVLNHLHRRKLDPNCASRDEGIQGNWNAEIAYDEYHTSIRDAKKRIGGAGLFLDIHGQSHPEAMVELGYDITRSALNSRSYSAKDSSIKILGQRMCGEAKSCFKNMINGAHSLGQYIQNTGYYTVPSNFNKRPGSSPYNSGGYSVEWHGSKSYGEIDAIQVEIPSYVRNQHEGPAFARNLAKAIKQYMDKYYW